MVSFERISHFIHSTAISVLLTFRQRTSYITFKNRKFSELFNFKPAPLVVHVLPQSESHFTVMKMRPTTDCAINHRFRRTLYHLVGINALDFFPRKRLYQLQIGRHSIHYDVKYSKKIEWWNSDLRTVLDLLRPNELNILIANSK